MNDDDRRINITLRTEMGTPRRRKTDIPLRDLLIQAIDASITANDGTTCPRCQSPQVRYSLNRAAWRCYSCGSDFAVKP